MKTEFEAEALHASGLSKRDPSHGSSRRWRSERHGTLLSLTMASLGSLLLAGCPEGASLANPEEHLTRECDAAAIFERRCAGSTCHTETEGTVKGGVDLISPGLEGRLLDVKATYPSLTVEGDGCPAEPELLINSTNVGASLLTLKLDDLQTCGDAMPIPHKTRALDADERRCVDIWVEAVINGETGGGVAGSDNGGAAQ